MGAGAAADAVASSLPASLSTTARTFAAGMLHALAMAFTDFPSSDIASIFLSLHAAWAGEGNALNNAISMMAGITARYRVIASPAS
ncbi:hypothetical protein G6F60_014618 [Rhizopus arrhizus]|nr:hypothetical protein G6F60_014618 [Rhizopus arrhizus]